MEGQTKVTQEEFALPFRLLKYCDGDLPKFGPSEEVLSAAASEMDTLRNNGTNIYQRNIYSLLSYYLNTLGNERVILAAEYDLMGLLVMLCSRSDYFSHFHHEKDVNYVMAEVQDIFSVENDGNESGGLLDLYSGQEFANLIYHLDVHLGVSLYILLQPFIDLVYEWCRLCLLRRIIDGPVMPYLFSSVTNLLTTHPEQAIKIISERGRHFLNYDKRSYLAAKNIGRDALDEYFSAHL